LTALRGHAHDFGFESIRDLKVSGVVLRSPSVRMSIREEQGPAMAWRISDKAVDFTTAASVEGQMVQSWATSIMVPSG
jgi:hypothetical protein